MITNPRIEEYMEKLIPSRDSLLQRMEQEAKEERIPIIQLPSIQFIRTLLLTLNPRHILEIGTAIGYSTIWLAMAAPQAKVTTMEIDFDRAQRARENLKQAGVADRVELILEDAGKGLASFYQFDCLFIDAAKGQYKAYLDLYLPHLAPGGLVISDNVLFKGLVAEETVENKRHAPMVEKLRLYNQYLFQHPELDTSILPVGDGLALSVKKKGVSL
jgi:predicted O-methyltransferase YrrM